MATGNVSNEHLNEALESIKQEAKDWQAITNGKTWRPEGWDSESIVIDVYQELKAEATDEKERKLVEAGADAILTHLRQQEGSSHILYRYRGGRVFTRTTYGKFEPPPRVSGHIVFIPDE